jgi:hypothetical protein
VAPAAERLARRRRCVCARLLVLALLVTLLVPTASRAAGWSHPFTFGGPYNGDVVAPQLAVSQTGQAAVTFELQDEDRPWVSQALLALRAVSGRISRFRVPGAKAVLDAAFAGQTLELLTGSGPAGQTCCSAAQALAAQGTAFTNRQTLLTGLTGATVGRLVTLPGAGLLAALATDRAVWAGQTQRGGRLRPMRRLSGPASWPQALAAAGLPGGRDAVAWSGAPGLTESATSVLIATGTARRAPWAPRFTVSVAAGHAVDGIVVAPSRVGATVAWVESWFDSTGAYQSQVVVADLAALLHPQTFQFPGEVVGGLVLVADRAGDQVLAVRACDPLGSCGVLALTRSARGQFGQPQPLGAIDASQEPVAVVSAKGAAVVGWIDQGKVLASGRRSASARLSAPRALSGVSDAADLTLAFGSGGQEFAAWDQGTLAPSVMGASYTP